MNLQIHELGQLFEEVQLKNILSDGKMFPDCTPLRSLTEINSTYQREKNRSGFDLKKFVLDNFELPPNYSSGFKSKQGTTVRQHITDLWPVLTRQPRPDNSSLIELPYPYVVPGGRFREVYYWDSYFTLLGLQISGWTDLIRNMVDNFAFLIDTFGYIPNGNRTYYLGRSQPPFFSLMIDLLAEENPELRKEILQKYLRALKKEYQFWMKGEELLTRGKSSNARVVRMPDGEILNRYWDENNTPRPESFREDVELSRKSNQKPEELFRNLRAAAESGWDFSTRWFLDGETFATIHTTDVVPVDLNCLLVHLEKMLAEAHLSAGDDGSAARFNELSDKRSNAVRKYFWNSQQNFFFDFDFIRECQKQMITLAAVSPLFFGVASSRQAESMEMVLREKFLMPGGLATTLTSSGQQWDAPNGWAPLQWLAFKGLQNYQLDRLAEELRSRWTNLNIKVYQETGRLTEKYNVCAKDGVGAGGEYPNQDGFGWTNGVLIAMLK